MADGSRPQSSTASTASAALAAKFVRSMLEARAAERHRERPPSLDATMSVYVSGMGWVEIRARGE